MSTGDTWTLGRRPALDGLRGVAVVFVVAAHAFPGHVAAAGAVGVTMFFALSGFLITSILLEEHTATGRVSLTGFYRRRALRLLPALAVVVVVLLALGLTSQTGAIAALFYLGNWAQIDAGHSLGLLSHTWSLGVEEQFYIVWPLLVIFLARGHRRIVLGLAVAGAVASLMARLAMWDGTWEAVRRVTFGADTRADALLWGCALAAVLHGSRVSHAPRPGVVAVGLLAVAALTPATWAGMFLAVPSLVPLAATAVIWALVTGTSSRLLEARALVLVGRRSYGLYLWHYPLFLYVLPRVDGGAWVQLGAVAAVTAAAWALTVLSWRFVEEPFLRLKVRPSGLLAASDSEYRHNSGADGAAALDARCATAAR